MDNNTNSILALETVLKEIENQPMLYLREETIEQILAFIAGYCIANKNSIFDRSGFELWFSKKYKFNYSNGYPTFYSMLKCEFSYEENIYINFFKEYYEYINTHYK